LICVLLAAWSWSRYYFWLLWPCSSVLRGPKHECESRSAFHCSPGLLHHTAACPGACVPLRRRFLRDGAMGDGVSRIVRRAHGLASREPAGGVARSTVSGPAAKARATRRLCGHHL